MGKLVVTEFVSLDGVFEDPGGAAKYVVSNTPTDPGWRGARVRSVDSCPFGLRCGRAADQWLARACLGSQNTAAHAAARKATATSSA